jgi:hypothetical protein
MEFSAWQKELLSALGQRGLSREDVISVMLVLSREELGKQMLVFLQENESLTADEICEKAGKLAFGENA